MPSTGYQRFSQRMWRGAANCGCTAALWLVLAGLWGSGGCRGSETASVSTSFAAPVMAGTLERERIDESSGIAASMLRGDLFWTHNDSGDKARLFAFDRQGRHLGTSHVLGAENDDWEDICSLRWQGEPCLLVADVGDNGLRRDYVILYLVAEPTDPKKDTQLVGQMRIRYPGGPCNCEAIGYDSSTGDVLLVEKQTKKQVSRVFRVKLAPEREPTQVHVASEIATVPLAIVTAMDISADGQTCIIGSYLHGCLYRRQDGQSWAEAFRGTPEIVPFPLRRQGEAVCFDAQGGLWLTSEKTPAPLWHLAPASP